MVLPTAMTSLPWSCPSLVVNSEEYRGLLLGFRHTVVLPLAGLPPTDFSGLDPSLSHLRIIDIGQACSTEAFEQDKRPPGSLLSDPNSTLLQLYPLDSQGTGQAQAR